MIDETESLPPPPRRCDVCDEPVGFDAVWERAAPFTALCAVCFAGYRHSMAEQVRMGRNMIWIGERLAAEKKAAARTGKAGSGAQDMVGRGEVKC